jgi:uncharacterized spore protein YtfJ
MDVQTVLTRASDLMSAGRVFGAPIERDGVTLVPVAVVVGGGGGGAGSGASGTGGTPTDGAGFGVLSMPIGAYVISNGQAKFVPSYDIGFLTLVGVGLGRAVLKRARRRHRH